MCEDNQLKTPTFASINLINLKSFHQKIISLHYPAFKVLSFLIAVVLVMIFIPRVGKFRYEYHQGKAWQHPTLYAPFDFTILKTEQQLRQERARVTAQIYPYFLFDFEETARGRELLEKLIAEKLGSSNSQRSATAKLAFMLYDRVQSRGIIQYNKVLDNLSPSQSINIVRDRVASVFPLGDIFTVTSAYEYCRKVADTSRFVDRSLIMLLLGESFVQNLIYDERMSKQELEQATARISPNFGLVLQGELIIAEGDLVDDEKNMLLSSLQGETERRSGSSERYRLLLTGQLMLVLIIFSILFLYMRFLKNDLFAELKKINLILLLMLITIIPSYLILERSPGLVYLLPFGILPIVLITFFDSRTTILVHLLTVFLVSIVVPNAFQFVFLQLVVGYVIVFSLVNHSRRLFFFRASILIFLTYLLVFVGFSLTQVSAFSLPEYSMFWMFGVSAALSLLSLPLIYILEKTFGLLTELSLLELSNTNSKLLRDLAERAPGTFQHSMQVANLAEDALRQVGGNVLLARTGALYHDIGKLDNPTYFIENQMGGYNPHNDLNPIESAQIIIGHVINGIEMARKAKLPAQIIDFIRTHHGTSRVNYFYIMEQRRNPGLSIDERAFRYRGPLPFSKETAVVMMADSVEAASRSIQQPTEQKINDLVENIINKQIETEQFSNANLTLRDISKVKKVFKKKLLNIYHVRIAYPD